MKTTSKPKKKHTTSSGANICRERVEGRPSGGGRGDQSKHKPTQKEIHRIEIKDMIYQDLALLC